MQSCARDHACATNRRGIALYQASSDFILPRDNARPRHFRVMTTSQTTPSVHSLQNISKAILNGRHLRGDGGVLYVKGDSCAYRFPSEFTDAGFRGALEDILEEDGQDHFFIVEEKEGRLHVRACEKSRVWDEVFGNMVQTTAPQASDLPRDKQSVPAPRIEEVDD